MSEDKELVKLIDAYLDESLQAEELADLNDLLENSKEFRDLFRSRVRLHADLSSHYDAENVDIITFPEKQSPQKSVSVLWPSILAAAALIMLYFTVPKEVRADTIIARISYSENAIWNNNEFENLISGSYELKEGMVELSLPNDVIVAVEGPAAFNIVNNKTLSLKRGKLSAHVGKKGRGFEVITPEGKIIDLGTRFGVWVPDNGSTEAHVFEGEINFIADKSVHNITESIAVKLENSKPVQSRADQSIFPMPGLNHTVELYNPGFDTNDDYLHMWPQKAAVWGGDECEIVDELNKVKPHSGRSMLRFLKPYVKHEADKGQNSCQVWQLVNLRHLKEEVALGGVTANLTAFVNRLPDLNSMKEFGLSIIAFNGEMSEAKNYWNRKNSPVSELIAQGGTTLTPDSDPQNWEPVHASLDIPPGTDYILLQLSIQDFSESPQFEGYFADSVSLSFSVKPRRSHRVSRWSGQSGDVSDAGKWNSGVKPDWSRDKIIISGKEKAMVSKSLELKQTLVVADGYNSYGSLHITKKGSMSLSSNGEFILGYNEKSVADFKLEGVLRTAGRAFIGRNNSRSTAVVDGGFWDASGGLIRMAQYGKRGIDTESTLKLINGGRVVSTSFDMIHDNSAVTVADGSLKVVQLRIGGSDGTAVVNLVKGSVTADILKFSKLGSFNFAGSGVLRLKGKLTAEELVSIENSTWLNNGQSLKAEDLNISYDKEYTVFSCQ